ncbi:type VI secretion system membrane subunit TssM [Dankookia rubra]|uniref:Type VI secretion system membrane subunit TssM n=1 Tax=Dankookia rubra TaxID=1442381 RepID=A0A4V3A9D0_9PROT|nr:type VI secretion system membrane subunit TssM [Dankookia rubra]TDH58655.1 type VI secretion system membrane subunit TssM [Dankookia rubra]
MSLLASALFVLRAREFWEFVGACILSLLIWAFGDIVEIGDERPLESPVARLVAILCIIVAWGTCNLWTQLRTHRARKELVAALAGPQSKESSGSLEFAELQTRFVDALRHLRRARSNMKRRRRWLYDLPWYVMIGPPGSGKTTAILQAGLDLPFEQSQIRTVGGTTYCDWILTDDAVLIDTAGRYSTQDNNPEVDKSVWLGLLDMLSKYRPQQPLSGIIVAIPTNLLLTGDQTFGRIRARLQEIEGRLCMRLPVYLLVTKSDLIAGFEPFFGDLSEAQRRQVWGHTFDHIPGQTNVPSRLKLNEALAGLIAQLDRRLLERLESEPDPRWRAQIFKFPSQVANLFEAVLHCTEYCFGPSRFENGSWLRGIYFVSGSQVGTPIDSISKVVSQIIGIKEAPLGIERFNGDRSFFLRQLFKDVIFREAELAGHDLTRNRQQQRRHLRGAVLAFLGLLTVGITGALGWSYAASRARNVEVEAALEAWSQQARPFAHTRLTVADANFTAVLPLLDQLSGLKAEHERPSSTGLHIALSQRATLEAQLNAAYRSALAKLLLPRLVLATEGRIQARLHDANYVLEALRVYLSLAGSVPIDRVLLEQFFASEIAPRSEFIRAAMHHVTALADLLPELETRERPTLDARLVADAQAALARVSLPKRGYTALVSNPGVRALPGWRVTDHAGPSASRTLTRRSGQPLGTEIPAIFTFDGFHRVFLPLLDDVARGIYAEHWLLSGRGTPDTSDADILKLKEEMLRLYYEDFIKIWDYTLRDVVIIAPTTLDQAVEAMRVLSGPTSPLRLLIQAVVHETGLTARLGPTPLEKHGPVERNAPHWENRGLDRLAKLVRPNSATPVDLSGEPVTTSFSYLRELIEGVNGARPALDEVLSVLDTLQAKMAEAAASPNPTEAFSGVGKTSAVQLAQVARRLPVPVNWMLESLGEAVSLASSGVRQRLNERWRTDILPVCRAVTAGKFPFAPSSRIDASLDDVARLFGPSGLIETFFKAHLASFVDTTRQPWYDTQSIGLQSGPLAQLARARRISSALFPNGSGSKLLFSLTPLSLSSAASAATLDVDGQDLRYAHGPPRTVSLSWPGPSDTSTIRMSFAPIGGGSTVTITKEGPWALLRLLQEEGRVVRTRQSEVLETELVAEGHVLRLRLRAASSENPFDMRLFSGFSCPEAF